LHQLAIKHSQFLADPVFGSQRKFQRLIRAKALNRYWSITPSCRNSRAFHIVKRWLKREGHFACNKSILLIMPDLTALENT
jgi:hypothetical protein